MQNFNPKPSGGFISDIYTDANGMTKPSKARKIPFRPPTTFDINDYQAEQGQRLKQQRRQRQDLQRQDIERQRNPQQFQQKLQQKHNDPSFRALNPGKAPRYY